MWVAPSQNLPPIGCSLCSSCVRKSVGNRRTHCAAISSMTAVMRRNRPVLSFPASELVTRPPTIPPIEPPTAINPKSRLPCSGVKTSAMNDQKIEDADPDEKNGREDRAFLRGWHPTHEQEENKKVRDGETVRHRNKSPPRHPRDDDGIKRVSDQHTDQRAGIHPRQIFNAPVGADLIADWPDNVI